MFAFRRSARRFLALASAVACSACDTANRQATAPSLLWIAISPKRVSVQELQTMEFTVTREPPQVQASWQCTLSDTALGTISVSSKGCVFTAARGSHLGTVTVRSGVFADQADLVVYGTGMTR